MRESTFTWKRDGINYFGRTWSPDSKVRGSIALIHGLGEHSGRYQHVASHLIEEGLNIMAFDLQGHGQTEGKRGHILSYASLFTAISHLLDKSREIAINKPLFLYGHSLGGNLVLNYALRYPKGLTGVIASSPWLKLAFDPPLLQVVLGRIMSRVYPSFTQNNQIKDGTLSHEEEIEEAYREDPLVHNQISARLFFQAYERGLWALEKASTLTIPLLLLHGTSDELTSWKASEEFAKRAKSARFIPWEGLYHELHNESKREAILDSIRAWLKEQMDRDYNP